MASFPVGKGNAELMHPGFKQREESCRKAHDSCLIFERFTEMSRLDMKNMSTLAEQSFQTAEKEISSTKIVHTATAVIFHTEERGVGDDDHVITADCNQVTKTFCVMAEVHKVKVVKLERKVWCKNIAK